MKPILVIIAAFLLVGSVILALAIFAPLPVPYYQDFSVMYYTGKALLHGIAIYDYPAQLSFVKELTPPGFSFFPYPYPPWYALSTLFLAWLPIQVAARVWFLINMVMLGLSAWLSIPAILRQSWKSGLAILAALLFIPALGLLVVGQYSAPVLLGAVLFVYAAGQAAGRSKPFWLAAALLLMTFKPHIGGLLFLAGFAWLFFDRSQLTRRALWLTVIGGVFLIALGFLVDRAWPLAYFQSLVHYRDLPGVQTCGLCASLSVLLVRVFTGQANTLAATGVSLILALLMAFLLFGRFRFALKDPFALMAVFAVVTLLIDPYLLNYDYILLLLPLFRLVIWAPWSSLLCYVLPWGELVAGRRDNIFLVSAALVTFVLILYYLLSSGDHGLDSSNGEAYNHINN